MTQPTRRSRATFLFLAALFLGPLLVSYVWYYGFDGLRFEPSAQHGDLIQPPRPLPELPVVGHAGYSSTTDLVTGYWSLVYFAPAACDESCRARLYDLRQLRIALGKGALRVRQLWVHTGGVPDPAWLALEHPALLAVSADGQEWPAWLAQFASTDEDLFAAGRVFIVDPLGNLMMSYPPDAELRGMHDDLDPLLELSHIG